MDRFEQAGLDLPPLRIYVHPNRDGCDGHMGFYGQHAERDRIDLCTRSEFYVLHELAHAWEQRGLSDARRQAFLHHAEMEWYDANARWTQRGVESLANTVAWGLLGRPLDQYEQRAMQDAQIRQAEELLFSGPPRDGLAKSLFRGQFMRSGVFPYPRLS